MAGPDYRRAAGWPHLAFETVGSTNTEASRLASIGEFERVWVTALEQFAGRGRRGREWESPRGNLFASAAFPVQASASVPLTGLPLLASLALRDAVVDVAPALTHQLGLKWPNDLLLNGKKLAGILLESTAGEGSATIITAGFGVNCAWHPQDALYATTSLRDEGVLMSADRLFAALALRFDQWLGVWDGGKGTETVRDGWLAHAVGLGEQLVARYSDGEVYGTFESLDESGFLMLRDDTGNLRQISAADIFFGNLHKAGA
ncbi:MAG: biotin--[acetyl-CoA-carboxylase] ligase [Pseudomonadota bacterium]